MSLVRHRGGAVIVATLVAALMLSVISMPEWARYWRPDWVALVLIYWCIALPERVGIGSAWFVGLLLDILNGTLLGSYAFSLAVVAYLAIVMHQRTRVLPLAHQAITILVLVIMYRMLLWWIDGITSQPSGSWEYWLTPVVDTLLWPWTFLLLRSLRRAFHVS